MIRPQHSMGQVLRQLGDLPDSLHPRIEWLRVEVGLGDPADTGRAWALLGPR